MALLTLQVDFSNGETMHVNATNEEFGNLIASCANKVEVITPSEAKAFIVSVKYCPYFEAAIRNTILEQFRELGKAIHELGAISAED